MAAMCQYCPAWIRCPKGNKAGLGFLVTTDRVKKWTHHLYPPVVEDAPPERGGESIGT